MNEITDVEEIYSEEYHLSSGDRGEKQWPAKQDMARALDEVLVPESVIDVGCGRGWWMEYWRRERPYVEVVGLDGCASLIKRTGQCAGFVRDRIRSCDLRAPDWALSWSNRVYRWDLVLCVEVTEHLEEGHAGGLLDGLCRLGPTVFFSSARPGQRGVHHVNCRPKRDWIERFRRRGYRLRMDLWREWHDKLQHRGKSYGRNIRRNAAFFTRP